MADLSLDRSFKCLTEPTFRHAHPVLSRFSGQTVTDNKNYFDFCEAVIPERIQEEKNAIATGLADEKRRKDYIHYVLTAVDPETGQKLTTNEVKSDASLLLAAGSDTISNAISSFMFYLARHQGARPARASTSTAAGTPRG
ncbi:hypothetical protein F4823DRAFT_564332 [Ustulina deusta]|nr:hypothetical protein F4823DRAFT_564332 [Ustulina deusta]